MNERDPRVDPWPGDVLQQRMRHMENGRHPRSTVKVLEVVPGGGTAIHGTRDDIPRTWSLEVWKAIMSDADVVERAP